MPPHVRHPFQSVWQAWITTDASSDLVVRPSRYVSPAIQHTGRLAGVAPDDPASLLHPLLAGTLRVWPADRRVRATSSPNDTHGAEHDKDKPDPFPNVERFLQDR